MPLYKFICLKNHITEVMLPMGEEIHYCGNKDCDMPVRKFIVTVPKVHYKGTGFYVTDDPHAKNAGST